MPWADTIAAPAVYCTLSHPSIWSPSLQKDTTSLWTYQWGLGEITGYFTVRMCKSKWIIVLTVCYVLLSAMQTANTYGLLVTGCPDCAEAIQLYHRHVEENFHEGWRGRIQLFSPAPFSLSSQRHVFLSGKKTKSRVTQIITWNLSWDFVEGWGTVGADPERQMDLGFFSPLNIVFRHFPQLRKNC